MLDAGLESGRIKMKRLTIACLASLMLCTGCMLFDGEFWTGTSDFNGAPMSPPSDSQGQSSNR
jgi:hypothetical protein